MDMKRHMVFFPKEKERDNYEMKVIIRKAGDS